MTFDESAKLKGTNELTDHFPKLSPMKTTCSGPTTVRTPFHRSHWSLHLTKRFCYRTGPWKKSPDISTYSRAGHATAGLYRRLRVMLDDTCVSGPCTMKAYPSKYFTI